MYNDIIRINIKYVCVVYKISNFDISLKYIKIISSDNIIF